MVERDHSNILSARKTLSERRLSELVEQIRKSEHVPEGLSIYVTGSYGRLEASRFSDLDLFFVHAGSLDAHSSVSRINEILMDAALIQICRDLSFPEFSGDGQYLQVHYVTEIMKKLGSPDDDYENMFTARLLLLLESRPLVNNNVYDQVTNAVIDAYFRDYPDHSGNFRPTFFANDILRFWKTLCLNYEHHRNLPDANEKERNKSHLRNLKLKFSRLMTCFSMLVGLCLDSDIITPQRVRELVNITPSDRLAEAASKHDLAPRLVQGILEEYAWFLQATERPRDEQLEWIGNKAVRDEAFGHAADYGSNFYRLLRDCVPDSTLRYLMV